MIEWHLLIKSVFTRCFFHINIELRVVWLSICDQVEEDDRFQSPTPGQHQQCKHCKTSLTMTSGDESASPHCYRLLTLIGNITAWNWITICSVCSFTKLFVKVSRVLDSTLRVIGHKSVIVQVKHQFASSWVITPLQFFHPRIVIITTFLTSIDLSFFISNFKTFRSHLF